MPELPEVETVRRTVLPHIQNRIIKKVVINHKDVLDGMEPETFARIFKDNAVAEIRRRGKYLILVLQGGEEIILHFRMTGQLVFFEDELPELSHIHAVFYFDKGGFYYRDVRRFGGFSVIGAGGSMEKGLKELGPEPMDKEFDFDYVRDKFNRSSGSVKAKLLDQHFAAGIGNIYADEILFACGIYPETPCKEVTDDEVKSIIKHAAAILNESIKNRGTTFRDYRDGSGEKGSNQNYLKVFRRWGQQCVNCGTTLEKLKCAGRSTTYCPNCQHK